MPAETVVLPEPKIGDDVHVFVPITRVDKAKRMVYGFGVTDKPPTSGRVRITKEAMEEALPEWMKYRNIREMHENKAVGKAKQVEMGITEDGHNGIYLGAYCHDEDTWAKIDSDDPILIGFSIGAGIKQVKAHDVTRMKIKEFSFVDTPDVSNCNFTEIVRRGEPLGILAPEGTMKERFAKALEVFKGSIDGMVEESKKLERSADVGLLERSLYLAGDMIRALQTLAYVKTAATVEAAEGKTAAALPSVMDAVVNAFKTAVMMAVGNETGEGAAPAADSGATPVPATAMSAPAEITRAAAKLSKATFSKVSEVYRLTASLLGLKAMTDDEISTARAANDKEETDAAAKTAADEKAAAAAAKAEDAPAKGTPAAAPAPAADAVAAAANAELTRKLGESKAENVALEKRIAAIETRVNDPKTRVNAGATGSGDKPGGKAPAREEQDAEYRAAVLAGEVTAVTSLQLRGYRPSKELEYDVTKELKRRGGVPAAASQGGN